MKLIGKHAQLMTLIVKRPRIPLALRAFGEELHRRDKDLLKARLITLIVKRPRIPVKRLESLENL